jgi:hypothetical protein
MNEKIVVGKVYKELLKGKTVNLVMEHELHGVTPAMINWWWDNMDNDSYRLWHPEDHLALEWQILPGRVGEALCAKPGECRERWSLFEFGSERLHP